MGSAVTVALPGMGAEFGVSAVVLGWITTAFLLASAAFLLPMGRLADLKGRKKVFLAGVIVFGAASALAGLAPRAGWLIAARVLQGAGGAMMFGTNIAILVSVFPPEERGRVLGINTAAVYIGLSLGPFVGGLLTQHLGWRSIFLMNVPIAILLGWLVVSRLKVEPSGTGGGAFDLAGSLVYGVSLVSFIGGMTRLGSSAGAALATAGALGLALFIAWESRIAHPVLDVRLFRGNRPFLLSNGAALVNYSATAGSAFLLSLYLQYLKGMSPRGAGTVMLVQPVVQAVISPWAGRLSDRIQPRYVASLGMVLTSAGLFTLAWLDDTTPLPVVVAGLVLLGTGFGLFSSPNTNAIMSSVRRQQLGVASAMAGTMRMTGQMLSMGVVMVVISVFMGQGAVTPELHGPFIGALRVSYCLLGAICAAGVVMSFSRGDVRRSGMPSG